MYAFIKLYEFSWSSNMRILVISTRFSLYVIILKKQKKKKKKKHAKT